MIVLGGAWVLLGLSVTDPVVEKTATIEILKPCSGADALAGLAWVMQQTKSPVTQGQANPKPPATGANPRPAPIQPSAKPATGAPASNGNRGPTSSTPAPQGARQATPPTSQPKTIEPSGSRQPANPANSRSDINKTGQPAQTGRANTTPPATGAGKPVPKEEPKQVGRPKDMGTGAGTAAGKPVPKEESKQVGRPKDMGTGAGTAAGKPVPKEESKQVGRPKDMGTGAGTAAGKPVPKEEPKQVGRPKDMGTGAGTAAGKPVPKEEPKQVGRPKDMGTGAGTAAGKPPVKVESLSSTNGAGNKAARENMANNGKPVPSGNGAVAGRSKPGTPAQAKATVEKTRVEANQKIDALPSAQKVEAQKALEETRRKNEAAHKVPAPGSNASVSKQPVKPVVSDKNMAQPLSQVKVDKSLADKFNSKDPKKALSSADYLGAVGKSNGIVFSDSTNKRIVDLAKDPKATSAEIEAYNKSLNGTPLSDSEVEILKNRLQQEMKKPSPDKAVLSALPAILQKNSSYKAEQESLDRNRDALTKLTESIGNLLPTTPALGGNGGMNNFIFPTGSVIAADDNYIPPAIPSLFIPNPGVRLVSGTASPIGSGVVLAYQPEVEASTDTASSQEPEERLKEVGLSGEEAGALLQQSQNTRFLRIANDTEKTVKVNLVYNSFDQDGKPVDNEAEPIWVRLRPGETVDLKEGDWRINASKVNIWAEAEDGSQNWEQFREKKLDCVPEGTYLAKLPEVMLFKVQ